MPGTIVFKPIEANLTHNTDLLTKMNPYCAFVIGTQRFNSQICKKGGKHPIWNDAISVPIGNETRLMVQVMDKDLITKDDTIGSFMVDLQEIQSSQHLSRWFPLFYKNKPAGELLMECNFQGDLGLNQGLGYGENLTRGGMMEEELIGTGTTSTGMMIEENQLQQGSLQQETFKSQGVYQEAPRIYQEQQQFVEPHTFLKEVDVVETRPVLKEIEVMEPVKVLKDVQVTEAVPVKKQIEITEPKLVQKEVEVIEPRLVTKQIQVIENVPVMKNVEVIESIPVMKEVETFEPQTFTKQIEVTEQVPVMKQVTVTEPITIKKPVEFVEPIITTKTITKEIQPTVIVDEQIKTEVGQATLVDVKTSMSQTTSTAYDERLRNFSNQSTYSGSTFAGQQSLDQRTLEQQRLNQNLDPTLGEHIHSSGRMSDKLREEKLKLEQKLDPTLHHNLANQGKGFNY